VALDWNWFEEKKRWKRGTGGQMMELFEKVRKGLECCLPETKEQAELSCAACPYDPCGHSVSLPISLIDDARKLITAQQERIAEPEAAQEARVMTLEEWENAPEPLDGECMCYEIKDKGLEAMLVKAFKACKELYGKNFRCWTSRPTDEQREAVKWDG
jgi:hypothetical protein